MYINDKNLIVIKFIDNRVPFIVHKFENLDTRLKKIFKKNIYIYISLCDIVIRTLRFYTCI